MVKFIRANTIGVLAIILLLVTGIVSTHTATAQGLASLYVAPASGSHQHGAAFSVVVYANTSGESVNAVEISMTYPDALLTFSGFSTAGTSFEIEAPGASGGSGSISLVRASVSGKSGSAVNVATLNFTAKSTNGTAALAFGGGSSLIRISDSTNVLGSTAGGSYSIFTNTGGSPPPPPPAPGPTPAPPTPNPGSPTSPSPSTPNPAPASSPSISDSSSEAGRSPSTNETDPARSNQQSVAQQNNDSGNKSTPASASSSSEEASLSPATTVGIVGATGFIIVLVGYGIKRLSGIKSARGGSYSGVITSAGMSSVPLTQSGAVSRTKEQVNELLAGIPDPGAPKPEVHDTVLKAGTVLQPTAKNDSPDGKN